MELLSLFLDNIATLTDDERVAVIDFLDDLLAGGFTIVKKEMPRMSEMPHDAPPSSSFQQLAQRRMRLKQWVERQRNDVLREATEYNWESVGISSFGFFAERLLNEIDTGTAILDILK